MNNFDINSLLSSFGFFYITQGQVIMLFVGLILLYLAINKKFEPLLLVPIGFGTILSNIPEIGLAYSGLEKIIFENNPETLSNLAMLLGLDFINDLRTVTYKWKAPSERPPELIGYDAEKTEPTHKEKMYGFIAQEVKESLDKYNITDFNGWTENEDTSQNVSYEMFVIPLVKAVQELSAKVEELESKLNN